jgi:hypothetical protein
MSNLLDRFNNGGLPVKNPLQPANSNSETFSVILRGANKQSGTTTDGTFFIDWKSFLPTKYTKFSVYGYFRSDPNATLGVSEDTIYINVEGLNNSNIFDSYHNGKSSVVAVANIEFWGSVASVNYFINQTANPFTFSMNYPNQSIHRVYITDHTGTITTATKITDWSLILQITPIL